MASIKDLGFETESVIPGDGWHCSHFFYSFDRSKLGRFVPLDLITGKKEFCQVVSKQELARFQLGLVSGHKADFSLMMMDPDPIKIQSFHHQLLSTRLGSALVANYSYVSISELSEYVQTVEQYGERLQRNGEDAASESYATKVNSYASRLEKMNLQRLTPVFPDWPVTCFYPMNKWRIVGANWFMLSESERNRLMGEHARSGIKFAGRVSQLITVGIGLDDWEWGVTLWATNPLHLKQIVYDMRFDEASAKYAEFGQFFTSYIADVEKILAICVGV